MNARVTLDEVAHVYTDERGKVVPGVTSILQELCDFRHVPYDVLEYARELGTAVHLACEYHDRGNLDWSTLDPAVEPYVQGYLKFLEREKPVILAIEEIVFHRLHGYAGKKDRGVMLFDSRGVLDIKTSTALDVGLVGPQLAAYLEAANSTLAATAPTPDLYLQDRYKDRWALQLTEGDYKLKRCDDPADFAVFLSCLNVKRWRQMHGFTR